MTTILLSLREKLTKQLMSVPYNTTDPGEILKMEMLTKEIRLINKKLGSEEHTANRKKMSNQ